MTYEQTADKIELAIKTKTRLNMVIKYSDGRPHNITFDPYIYGSDLMQHSFVFGFLADHLLPYNIRFTDIISISSTSDKFELVNWVNFYYSLEQEYYAFVDGFQEHIYNGGHNGGPLQ